MGNAVVLQEATHPPLKFGGDVAILYSLVKFILIHRVLGVIMTAMRIHSEWYMLVSR